MKTNRFLIDARINERMVAGDHWYGLNIKSLDPIVINIIKRIGDFKVSSLMGQEVGIHYSTFKEADKTMDAAIKGFNEQIKRDMERIHQKDIDEDVLYGGYQTGSGFSYYWWDNDIIDRDNIGGIDGVQVDSINFFPANPNQFISGNINDIDKQDYIILSMRMTVAQARQIGRNNGLEEEQLNLIVPDEPEKQIQYDKGQHEKTDNKRVTVLLYMYFDKEEDAEGKPTVWFSKHTQNVEIQPPTDSELSIYPVAPFNWDKRRDFIYGQAEVTSMRANQIFLNKIMSMAMRSVQMTAFPKILYDKSRAAKPSNLLGGTLAVQGLEGQSIRNAVDLLRGEGVNADVFNLFNTILATTKDVHGASENALGEAKPENTSALLASQKQAGIPLEGIGRRRNTYRERVGKIALNFYTTKFNVKRKGEEGDFMGVDFDMADFEIGIDVGQMAQYSEALAINVLNELLAGEKIDFVEYLERYPKGIIPKQQELIDARKETEIDPEEDISQEELEDLSEEFRALPPEQQEEAKASGNILQWLIDRRDLPVEEEV